MMRNFGDASITPLNKFLDMSLITKDTNITPNISGSDAGKSVLDLASGYSVWVSNDDIVVKAKKEDKGEVRGVVITKGDVYFDSSSENGVTDFEGVINCRWKGLCEWKCKDNRCISRDLSSSSSRVPSDR